MTTPTLQDIDKLRQDGFRPEAVGCIISAGKKLLLLYKEEHKLWQLPQGEIGNGESVDQALKKALTEELGEELMGRCVLPEELVLSFEQVEFPPSVCGAEVLTTDEGKEVPMRGKAYYFCVLNLQAMPAHSSLSLRAHPSESKTGRQGGEELDISQSEFDDYIFASYDQAEFLANQIYQRGKKRITLAVIKVLKEKGLIG